MNEMHDINKFHLIVELYNHHNFDMNLLNNDSISWDSYDINSKNPFQQRKNIKQQKISRNKISDGDNSRIEINYLLKQTNLVNIGINVLLKYAILNSNIFPFHLFYLFLILKV